MPESTQNETGQPRAVQPQSDRPRTPEGSLTYAGAGVSIEAADRAVEAMRDLVASTATPGVIGSIGGFGGMFEMPSGYRRPVLVATTDGVGTKMAVATATGRFETVGIDLVAMCADDLVCCGARPLFLLDYQLLGRTDPDQVRSLMDGIAEGCRQAGMAIIGGELAEHPGLLAPGQVDIAGFAVGVVERDGIIDGTEMTVPGDVLIGLMSPGLRSNGYSLARRALLEHAGRSLEEPAWPGAPMSLADELLRPSVIYSPAVLALLAAKVPLHAAAHITGGGLPGNLPRVMSPGVDAEIDRSTWTTPRIFNEIRDAGAVTDAEMARVFNLGIGMVLAVPPSAVEGALSVIEDCGHRSAVVGRLLAGNRKVHIVGTGP